MSKKKARSIVVKLRYAELTGKEIKPSLIRKYNAALGVLLKI